MLQFGLPRWLPAGLVMATIACHPAALASSIAPEAPASSLDNKQPDLMNRDGIRIGTRYYPAVKLKALILLFHQAGSSQDEYANIPPRLVTDGYSALAIDQHSGGSLVGRNDTVARIGQAMRFDDDKQDLDVALDRVGQRGLPVIVWGSSYAAAPAFELTADNPGRVAGLLAFSPGEFLKGASRVRGAAHPHPGLYRHGFGRGGADATNFRCARQQGQSPGSAGRARRARISCARSRSQSTRGKRQLAQCRGILAPP